MVNLSRTRGIIIKVRSRERSGRPIHKSEFSLDDKKSLERELRLWKDKLGVPKEEFEKVIKKPFDEQDVKDVKELMKKDIDKSNEKMKKAFSKKGIS